MDVARLFDANLEREIVAALIAAPELHDELPRAFGLDVLADLQAQHAFEAFANLRARGDRVTVDTIREEVERRVGHRDARWIDELTSIKAPAREVTIESVEIVIELARSRAAAIAEAEILAPTPPVTAPQEHKPPIPFITVHDAIEELVAFADRPIYPTPFPTLNEALGFGGLLGGQVYNLAAGTGRGKTSATSQIAMHQAERGDVVIAFYEAFGGYVIARMAAGPLGIRSNDIIRDAAKHGAAVLRTVPHRIHLLDRPSLAVIRDAADELAQKSGTAPLVIVDYMSKVADAMQATQARPDPRLAMSQASSELLELADGSGSPVIAVSATSRMSNKRAADPRSVAPYELVDVPKESGAVEYDSAGLVVISLSDDWDGDERIATWTVAKARYGIEQHIEMRFDGRRGAWRDLGRVESKGKGKNMEPKLRDKIRTALVTPAPSATKLAERVKAKKQDTLAEIRELISEGQIAQTSNGLEWAA